MYCDECKEREATVHYSQNINGEHSEMHLCEECAKSKGQLDFMFNFQPTFSIEKLLAGLIGQEAHGFGPAGVSFEQGLYCENCGLTYNEFAKQGRLGCSQCYSRFKDRLLPVVRKIHGSTCHTGKVPRRSGLRLHLKREIDRLRGELKQAIEAEEYELAAKLRDEIRALEAKGKTSA